MDADRENSGFWVAHRNRAIERAAEAFGVQRLVEVGAGSGAVSSQLSRRGIDILAIEPHLAGALATASSGVLTVAAFLHDLEFETSSVPNFGLFDVLEHLPDPNVVLKEIHRTLLPDGHLIISVPVGQWLWGALDETVGHHRRYSRRRLSRLLEQNGFSIEHSRFLFLSLVPVAFITRAIPYRLGNRTTDVESIKAQLGPSRLVSRLISGILRLESKVRVPYGLSLLVVAAKTSGRKN